MEAKICERGERRKRQNERKRVEIVADKISKDHRRVTFMVNKRVLHVR